MDEAIVDDNPVAEGQQQQQQGLTKQQQLQLQEKRRRMFGSFLSDLPDNALRAIASKWKQGEKGPLFDDELAA